MDNQIENLFFIDDTLFKIIYDYEKNIFYSTENTELFYQIMSQLKNTETCNNNEDIVFFKNQIKKRFYHKSTYQFLKTWISPKITLMLTQSCNLRCKYCYGGESGQYKTNGEYMSIETARKAINFLVKNTSTIKNPVYHITFFGGEPLLNFDVLKKTVEYAQEIESYNRGTFKFTMTTNGSIINNHMLDFIIKNKIAVMFSLDGPDYIHNKNRVFRNGKGSHSNVIRTIKMFRDKKYPFSIRATLEHSFTEQYESLVRYFSDLGAEQIHISRVCNYQDDLPLFPLDVNEAAIEWEGIKRFSKSIENKIINGELPKHIPFLNIMNTIHNASKDFNSCGFMKGSTAVSCDGKLYPCHRFVGMSNFHFGDIFSGIDEEKQKIICNNLDRATMKDCKKCFAKYICKRTCVRDIAKSGGKFISFDKKYCDLMRDTIRHTILIYKNIYKCHPEFISLMCNANKESIPNKSTK
jgi:uncharacterized protein